MDDEKTCPKCNNAMKLLEVSCSLPAYIDQTSGSRHTVSTTESFPIEVYRCTRCRYVELYAETL